MAPVPDHAPLDVSVVNEFPQPPYADGTKSHGLGIPWEDCRWNFLGRRP